MSLLIKQFRAEVSKSKDYRMKVEAEFDVGYSTGFLGFDFRNGSVVHTTVQGEPVKYTLVGLPDGAMAMVIGRSNCGKTAWCVQAAANIVRPYENGAIFHDDIENGLKRQRALTLTRFTEEEFNKKYIHRNTGITAENFYERLKMIHDTKLQSRSDFEYDTGYLDTEGNKIFKLVPTVYILDSVALLMPGKFTEEDELSGQMGATAVARNNASLFKRVIPMLKASNMILLCINHINQKVSINAFSITKAQLSYLKPDETLPGGNTVIYLANTVVRLDDNTKLKSEEQFGIDGNFVDFTLLKSRTNKVGKSVTLVFDQSTGYDPVLSLFILLKQNNKINGAGVGLYFGERNDIKFRMSNFKTKLADNEELRILFAEECRNVLDSFLVENQLVENVQVSVDDLILGDLYS